MIGLSIRVLCPPLRMEHIPTSSNPALIFIPNQYQSKVCVVGWIHEEVDYNVEAFVLVEPKDHLKRLHLRGKSFKEFGFVGSTHLA